MKLNSEVLLLGSKWRACDWGRAGCLLLRRWCPACPSTAVDNGTSVASERVVDLYDRVTKRVFNFKREIDNYSNIT